MGGWGALIVALGGQGSSQWAPRLEGYRGSGHFPERKLPSSQARVTSPQSETSYKDHLVYFNMLVVHTDQGNIWEVWTLLTTIAGFKTMTLVNLKSSLFVTSKQQQAGTKELV